MRSTVPYNLRVRIRCDIDTILCCYLIPFLFFLGSSFEREERITTHPQDGIKTVFRAVLFEYEVASYSYEYLVLK